MHKRWKKNMAGMMAAGHPECRYVATVCASYAVEMMNKVRRALTIGGPTFIHSLDPCPKGWDYDPMLSPRARASWPSRPASSRSTRSRTGS